MGTPLWCLMNGCEDADAGVDYEEIKISLELKRNYFRPKCVSWILTDTTTLGVSNRTDRSALWQFSATLVVLSIGG